MLKDAPDSAVLALRISEMMRYSVDSTTSDIVLLNKELDAIKVFLELQEARFENDYNVIFSIKNYINTFKIPPLILLTLIENSFKYGVTNINEEFLLIPLN